MNIKEVKIQNFRSISNLTLKINENNLFVICGANNVGKTNFLRALDLFFSLDITKFDADIDIPYQIAEGSRGFGYKTKIKVTFLNNKKEKIIITTIFSRKKVDGNTLKLEGKKGQISLKEPEIRKIVQSFKFIFIESSNVDLSKKISELVSNDVLLTVDKLRKKKTQSLEKLEQFITKSNVALNDIQTEITLIIKNHVDKIDGIDSRNWKAEIYFPEFVSLKDAISNLITFTLHDTNKRNIETKGSGIQKIVLLSLIKYISEKSSKRIIWGIDEPEAFLQPALQKKVNLILKEFSNDFPIIITTHSNHFIDLTYLDNTFLFEGNIEKKEYARKPNEVFYKTETIINSASGIEKVLSIKKYLGLNKNDSWELLPLNLLVEGQEDKDYLTSLFKYYHLDVPNILVAGGADKVRGYLQFLNDFAEEIKFKPKIICIFDKDSAGKNIYQSLNHATKYKFDLNTQYIPRFDGNTENDFEHTIEDILPPEIFFVGINSILKKKKYSRLIKSQYSKRIMPANNKRSVLDIVIDLISERNIDKERFNAKTESVKIYVCKHICMKIEKKDFSKILNENTYLKKYLIGLTREL